MRCADRPLAGKNLRRAVVSVRRTTTLQTTKNQACFNKLEMMADVKTEVGVASPTNDLRNVSFGENQSKMKEENGEVKMLSTEMRGISVAKCEARCHVIARIPTRVELKTLTHLAKRPAINIDFKDLSYTVRQPLSTDGTNSKTILKKVSGSFKSGELTAILGSSGAGKSTLMNIIAGYVTIGVSGTIETNGHPRQLKLFNKLTSYIMQEDLLQPQLTVQESMEFAANLKLGKELSPQQKIQVVDEILNTLLLKSAKDTRTECLSGGQRKRLSVALELVSNPPVIFLDEPTTGLDMVSTTQLMTVLKQLARQGRTIICTVHQPTATVFKTMDLVYVMAEGECMYQGSQDQLVPFLARCNLNCPTTYNPADFVMEVISTDEREHLPKLCAASQNGKLRIEPPEAALNRKPVIKVTKLCRKETVAVMPKVYSSEENEGNVEMEYPTNFFEQTLILLKRRFIQQLRNKTALWIMFFHHILSAILVGGIFFGVGNNGNRSFDNVKLIMSSVVFYMYTHIMVNVLLFPFDVKRLRREYFNRWYGLKSYFFALSLSTIPQQVIFGFFFVIIQYPMTDQPMEFKRILWYYIIGLLSGIASEGIGLTIGAIFQDMNGCVVGPVTVVPMLAVAVYGMGFGRAIEPFMQIFMNASYLRFGIVGLAAAVYSDREEMLCDPAEANYCHYKDPSILMRDLGMEGSTPEYQALGLIGFIVLYRATAFISLRLRLSLQFSTKLFTYLDKVLRQR